jgi:cytochrome bd-type quinol oxidase subunit 1
MTGGDMMAETTGVRRSRAWYLLPIFFSIIGGVIAYFVLRDDDPKKAKNCLWLGIILTAIGVVITVIMYAVYGMGELGYWPVDDSI